MLLLLHKHLDVATGSARVCFVASETTHVQFRPGSLPILLLEQVLYGVPPSGGRARELSILEAVECAIHVLSQPVVGQSG